MSENEKYYWLTTISGKSYKGYKLERASQNGVQELHLSRTRADGTEETLVFNGAQVEVVSEVQGKYEAWKSKGQKEERGL